MLNLNLYEDEFDQYGKDKEKRMKEIFSKIVYMENHEINDLKKEK